MSVKYLNVDEYTCFRNDENAFTLHRVWMENLSMVDSINELDAKSKQIQYNFQFTVNMFITIS